MLKHSSEHRVRHCGEFCEYLKVCSRIGVDKCREVSQFLRPNAKSHSETQVEGHLNLAVRKLKVTQELVSHLNCQVQKMEQVMANFEETSQQMERLKTEDLEKSKQMERLIARDNEMTEQIQQLIDRDKEKCREMEQLMEKVKEQTQQIEGSE